MGVFFGQQRELTLAEGWDSRIRPFSQRLGAGQREQSLQVSVKWACLRLRADLISTTPLDQFTRSASGEQVEIKKWPVLRAPGGASMDAEEWFYASQFDLDEVGNCFGIVQRRGPHGLPAEIELVPADAVTVRLRNGLKEISIDGKVQNLADVWHEKQFPVAGSPVGLSPAAYAAMVARGYLDAQRFAMDWFAGAGIPAAHMRNKEKTVSDSDAAKIKARMAETVQTGGVMVTGADWEFSMMGAKASESQWVEAQRLAGPDLCRYFGVPADMVDVEATAAGNITYANVTQRNLQLLVINLGPAFTRRERAFSNRLLPSPQFCKFNTDALLRMDPRGRYEMHKIGIDSRFLAPSEARGLENRAPFTPEQLSEFAALWPTRDNAAPKEA